MLWARIVLGSLPESRAKPWTNEIGEDCTSVNLRVGYAVHLDAPLHWLSTDGLMMLGAEYISLSSRKIISTLP